MWRATYPTVALLSLWFVMAITGSRACPSTLRLLLISDIHDDVAAVRRLRSLLERQGVLERIDVVLSPGDLTTTPCSRDSDVQRAYDRPAKRMLEELEAFGRPVFFVPGNHDPLSMFNESASGKEAGAQNAHGRTFEVAPGLRLLGWGGSSAAFEDGQRVWEGWPYAESEVSSGLAALLSREARLSDATLLVLTHGGPSGVGTTAVTGPDPNDPDAPGVRTHAVDTGSPSLRAALAGASMQQRTAAVVHGHTHAGVGAARLGSLPVTNPGSLRYGGYFGILTLQRDAHSDAHADTHGDAHSDTHADAHGAAHANTHGAAHGDTARRPRWRVLGVESLQMNSCGGAAAGDGGALGRLLAAPCEAVRFWSVVTPGLGLALVGLSSLAWSCRISRKLDSCHLCRSRSESCHSPLERARILGGKDWW